KAFIGANGIDGHNITTANEEEGNADAIILNNAIEKYIVADNSKFDSYSFYTFYRLDDVNAIVTDDNISQRMKDKYQSYTKVL
ncbi:DeoR family transcriptional regulator, partial [Streptococcus salivarius]|nr:DeoR family transcriptional regulator [Streptococcus salivarius]